MWTRRLIVCLTLLSSPAVAHHWYPIDCCSEHDCRVRSCDMLEQTNDGGMRDLETHQIYSPDQVRPSQDGDCHVCTGGGHRHGPPICVFTVLGS